MNADSINQAGRSLESFEIFIKLLFEDAPSSMSSSLFVSVPFGSVCEFFDKVRLYFDTLSREDKATLPTPTRPLGQLPKRCLNFLQQNKGKSAPGICWKHKK